MCGPGARDYLNSVSVSLPSEDLARALRRQRLRVVVERLMPWVSLLVSIVGVLMMDHSESRGGLIAIGAAVSWIAFLIVALVHRPRPGHDAPPGRVTLVVRFASTFANQSLIHYSLLFCAPFYLEACAWTPLQCVFAAVFAVAVVVASWDPWCVRVLLSPRLGPLLLAFASFVGWNAALPMLGVPHRLSIWCSTLAVGIGIPLITVACGVTGPRRLWSIVVGAALPLLMMVGGIEALPPAPLRMVSAQIGTGISEREPTGVAETYAKVPRELVCWTAVRAPRGLDDDLLHVWSVDGVVLRAVPVDVRGGRALGFRTWSRQPLRASARGRYRCDVVTTLGQRLGGTSVLVGSKAGLESRTKKRYAVFHGRRRQPQQVEEEEGPRGAREARRAEPPLARDERGRARASGKEARARRKAARRTQARTRRVSQHACGTGMYVPMLRAQTSSERCAAITCAHSGSHSPRASCTHAHKQKALSSVL
jgi:hypothetical protein